MAFGGILQVVFPAPNQTVPPGDLDVVGYVTGRGWPEPDPATVTLRLNGGPQIMADLSINSKPGDHYWTAAFSTPPGSFKVAPGADAVTVTASDDIGTKTEIVRFFVGTPPTPALLTGTLTAKSGSSAGPVPEDVGLLFVPPSSVEITSFPTIANPPVAIGPATLTSTITYLGSGTGTFDPADGSISIPGVNLHVDVKVSAFGFFSTSAGADLTVTLTTGRSGSPIFTDFGAPLQPSGAVTLVGDGTYSAPIFGVTDAGITLSGTINPHP